MSCQTAVAVEPTVEERAKIVEDAYIYAFPMVMNYGTMYEFCVDKESSQYKGPFNYLSNTARVFTPKDTAIVTPNSDTPYSMIYMDLRAEPIVLSVPEIEKSRYYSIQLVDMYTFNIGYIGSRATGNQAGRYLIAGPGWKGETPAGIDKVFRTETDYIFAIYRTQLFNPADLENVVKIQAQYGAVPLSTFLKTAPPAAPATPNYPKFDKKAAFGGDFIAYLNFVLQFCPPVPAEDALRARFAQIGIGAGKPFEFAKLPPAEQEAIGRGIKAAMAKLEARKTTLGRDENGWRVGAAFGDRAFYQGDWTLRAAAAAAGIYGNDMVEALYPLLAADSTGAHPDCTTNRYTITFPKDGLPPVNAFWSVTMYDGKTQLLVDNPLNRYLINSPMLPDLKKNADGSLTIYLQHESPGADRESNWLPAPAGPIFVAMRLYWPREAALKGDWKPPVLQLVK
ncbi:MAG TPA: DUF1254 domain-containing protein [Pirellulales bacterium]